MLSLRFKGELIMICKCLGFFWKASAVFVPLFGALHVLFIIFNDEFLSEHIVLTLILTALFSFTCCLLTLSQICVLRRKAHAIYKNIDQLWDTDLKIRNGTEEVPYHKLSCHYKDIGTTLMKILFRNPIAFCKFRPAYGMLFVTGFVFLFASIASLRLAKESNLKDDVYCIAVELALPMILLIGMVYLLANSGVYIAEKAYDVYIPFEEFVQVPVKVVVGKTVAIFLTGGGTYWFLAFFLVSITALSIISSNYLYHATVIDDVLKSLLPPIFPDPRKVLRTVLIITSVVFVNVLVGMIVSAFSEAHTAIRCLIEKNWQRNLKAIAFLLEDTEAETLQDLKNALCNKSNQPLTQDEEKAFNYISWPIWQTKAPFMLQRPRRESFDPEILDEKEELDNKGGPEYIQQFDATVKPEHKESKDADQPNPPVAQEVLDSAEPSTSSKCDELRLGEPSTSSSSF